MTSPSSSSSSSSSSSPSLRIRLRVHLSPSKSLIPNAVAAVPPELKAFILKQLSARVPKWNLLSMGNDVQVEELSGGLTNKLYKAQLTEPSKHSDIEFDQVVIRFFGKDTDLFFERRTEQVVSQTLSDNRQGVRVFGTFSEYGGGRLEAFYRGRTLRTDDLHNSEISVRIASSMAKLHCLDMPLDRSPRLDQNLKKWFASAVSLNVRHVHSDHSTHIFTFQRLHEEIEFFLKQIQRINSPVVFCHNDLQEGNVIYDDDKKKVQVIDYEYSAYNYRAADIANHFCEHYIDYQVKTPPFFSLDVERYPTSEHQRRFLREYLSVYRSQRRQQLDHSSSVDSQHSAADLFDSADDEVSDDDVDLLQKEVHWFMLGSHLQWGIWSIIQYVKSDIAFGYMEYAHARFSEYLREKEVLLKEASAQKGGPFGVVVPPTTTGARSSPPPSSSPRAI